MTSSVGLALCLLSPFQYVFLLLLFSLISHHLHSCTLVTFKWKFCVRRALLSVFLLIPPVYLGQSIPTTLMALLGSTLLATIQMSQATPFLKAHGRWVLFYPCSLSFYSCIPTLVLTTFPLEFSLLFRSIRSSFSLQKTSSWNWLSTSIAIWLRGC